MIPAVLLQANCTISVADGSVFPCYVVSVDHGMSIVAEESQSRNGRTPYFRRFTSGSFGMTVIWPTYLAYVTFNEWALAYCQRLTNPRLKTATYQLRVKIPAYRFDRSCIPSGERGPFCSFGQAWDDAGAYTQKLNFESSSDALDVEGPYVSEFEGARNDGETSKYFYPAGTQLKGREEPALGNLTALDRKLL